MNISEFTIVGRVGGKREKNPKTMGKCDLCG